MTSPPEKERVDTGRLSYQCVSFRVLNSYVSTDGKQTCGKAIADDYTELYTGGLTMKVRQLRQLAVQQNYQHAASKQNAKQNKAGSFLRNIFVSFSASSMESTAHLPQHHVPSSQTEFYRKNVCESRTNPSSHIHNFIHWYIPSARYATRMHPLQSCKIVTDVEFFRALRKRYIESGNCYQFFSFKRPAALRFFKVRMLMVPLRTIHTTKLTSTLLKFRLYHQQLVDIQRTGAWHMERRPGAGESAL